MSRYNMCPHTPSTYSDIYLIMDQLAQYLLSKRLTPTRWFGLHRAHPHMHPYHSGSVVSRLASNYRAGYFGSIRAGNLNLH